MLAPPRPPKLASSVTAPSTNCLSVPFLLQLSLPRMCLICICIEGLLKRCSPIARCIPKNGVPPRDGSLRVLYAARIGHCRSCPLRVQCQESSTTIKPRRVSAVFWLLESPLSDSSPTREDTPEPLPLAPVVWKDWPRCRIRREWLKVVRSETVGLTSSTTLAPSPVTLPTENLLTRAQRAHSRLSWEQPLARHRRPSDAPPLIVHLHGLPATFAQSFGFALLATA